VLSLCCACAGGGVYWGVLVCVVCVWPTTYMARPQTGRLGPEYSSTAATSCRQQQQQQQPDALSREGHGARGQWPVATETGQAAQPGSGIRGMLRNAPLRGIWK
jgi:hypothetical protein